MKHTKTKTRLVLWQEETDELGRKRVVNAAVQAKVAALDAKEKEMRAMKGKSEAWRKKNMEAMARVEQEEQQKLAELEAEVERMKLEWRDLDWPELERLLGKERLLKARSMGKAWLENEFARERKKLAEREAEASIPLELRLARSKAEWEQKMKKKVLSPSEKRAARLHAKQQALKAIEEMKKELAGIMGQNEAEVEWMKREWPDLDWQELQRLLGKEQLSMARSLGKEWLENEFAEEQKKLAEREAEPIERLVRMLQESVRSR